MLKDIDHPFDRGKKVYDIAFENVQAGQRSAHLFRLAEHHRVDPGRRFSFDRRYEFHHLSHTLLLRKHSKSCFGAVPELQVSLNPLPGFPEDKVTGGREKPPVRVR